MFSFLHPFPPAVNTDPEHHRFSLAIFQTVSSALMPNGYKSNDLPGHASSVTLLPIYVFVLLPTLV